MPPSPPLCRSRSTSPHNSGRCATSMSSRSSQPSCATATPAHAPSSDSLRVLRKLTISHRCDSYWATCCKYALRNDMMGCMKRGYVRVSTTDQDLALQVDELKAAGCERMYEDKRTGKNADRPGLKRLLREVEPGDVVIVYKLDRMSRSVRDLLNICHDLDGRGVEFRSLNDPIDTTTALGRCFFQMVAVFAELERSFIVERTTAG